MKKNNLNFDEIQMKGLNKSELVDLSGGFVFLAVLGVIGTAVGLYEWGYQYAHRKLEQV